MDVVRILDGCFCCPGNCCNLSPVSPVNFSVSLTSSCYRPGGFGYLTQVVVGGRLWTGTLEYGVGDCVYNTTVSLECFGNTWRLSFNMLTGSEGCFDPDAASYNGTERRRSGHCSPITFLFNGLLETGDEFNPCQGVPWQAAVVQEL